ncbi:MAG: L-threonylcarbamoyladenylate synthase [Acutalibacteraceae bacterium]
MVSHIPEHAKRLMETFWPGPLTVILPKSNLVPDQVSAGLPTVAVRFPSHPTARAVIQKAGVPLAAPSANVSGSPSPTAAAHVLHDLDGKIDAVIDGGPCTVGLESMVITLAEETPVLLRPGAVTLEQLQQVLGTVKMADAVLHQLEQGSVAASPGMKYKHYAPKAKLILLEVLTKHFSLCECACSGRGCTLCYDGQENCFCVPAVTYSKDCPRSKHSNYSVRCVNWMT